MFLFKELPTMEPRCLPAAFLAGREGKSGEPWGAGQGHDVGFSGAWALLKGFNLSLSCLNRDL